MKIATEMCAEFWAVSSKTGKNVFTSLQRHINKSQIKEMCVVLGENVQGFFFRVAALAFERSILKDMENGAPSSVGQSESISKISPLWS